MTIETITAALAWTLLINIVILMVSTILLILLGDFSAKFHSKLFGLDKSEVRKMYFEYLGNYKIAVLVFNLAPYLALRIVQ